MVNRSKDFWMVAYFLSRYGQVLEKGTNPPVELGTADWKVAYRIFYDSLNQGRAILTFERSLKNARDAFDSHIGVSGRAGWRDNKRQPAGLNNVASEIFMKYSNTDRETLWNEVKVYAGQMSRSYNQVLNDLASIQESEGQKEIVSRTEGGIKVVVSFKYERDSRLRDDAFRIHGYDCGVCGFNFQAKYGDWGKNFGEVHHVNLLSARGEKKTDPRSDLKVVCANCHRMLHRKRGIVLSVEELKQKINTKS